jgi:hypothetical protein
LFSYLAAEKFQSSSLGGSITLKTCSQKIAKAQRKSKKKKSKNKLSFLFHVTETLKLLNCTKNLGACINQLDKRIEG